MPERNIRRKPAMTRTLVIEASGNLWGSERALLDLLDTLPILEVGVCCPPQMPLNAELEKRQIRTLPYYVYGLHKKSRRHRLQAAAGVLRACMEFRPDVIYLNQCGSYKVTLPAATILDLPIVTHIRIFEDAAILQCNGRDHVSFGGLSPLVRQSRRKSEDSDNSTPSGFIEFMTDTLLRCSRIKTFLRKRGLLTASPVSGAWYRSKGRMFLSELCAYPRNSRKLGNVCFVGDGEQPFINDLQQMASRGNPSFAIQWLGFVGDVFSLLPTCSVLVCPSHKEPLGRVILEAWDAGVVPVAFAGSGGAAEIVAAAQGGILYDEQTPSSLATALHEALELDPGRRAQLVNNGRSWMFRNCDLETYGKTISTILSSAG
jgi:Glycosyl transferases group 1